MPVDLMTIGRPADLDSAGEMVDRNMAGVTQANQNYAQYKRDASLVEKPFQTISGPTAESVNSGADKMGTFEFLARGGIENTAKGVANTIFEKRQKKEKMAQFEKLLSMQEQGGQMLYDDAVQTYGEPIKQWIPPTSFFFDQETGSFMPYKYAERVAYGVTAYEKAKARAEQMQTISGSIAGADNRQAAAAGVLAGGGEVKDYKDAIETIPPTMDAKQLSEIKENEADVTLKGIQGGKEKAMEGYYKRMPKVGSGGSGGKPKTPQDNINELRGRIIQYENLMKNARAELRDPNRNPDAEADSAISKRIKSYERVIGELNQDVDREKAKIDNDPNYTPPGAESYIIADDLLNDISTRLGAGYTIDEQNGEVLNESGEPQPGMYDEYVLSQVLNTMDEQGIKLPQLGPDQKGRAALIKQSIATAGLAETIDALNQLKAGGAQ